MCTQTYNRYECGCKQKGEFEQCDRLYNLGVNLQCATAENKDKVLRSYCATHLVKEGKGTAVYRIREPQNVEGSSESDGSPGRRESSPEQSTGV